MDSNLYQLTDDEIMNISGGSIDALTVVEKANSFFARKLVCTTFQLTYNAMASNGTQLLKYNDGKPYASYA